MSTPYREPTDVSDLDEPARRYPVIVEEIRHYVLWIDAEEPKEAPEAYHYEPFDPGRQAMYAFYWEARPPDKYEWEYIARPGTDGGEWPGMQADAHVRTHAEHLRQQRRELARAACRAAGHPIPEVAARQWPDYCDTCGRIDPSERTAVDPSAAGGEPEATSQIGSDIGGEQCAAS